MPGIDNERGEAAPLHPGLGGSGQSIPLSDIESLVDATTFDGHLSALLAYALEKALMYEPPSHADPSHAPHPGVQAAIRAFAASKQVEGQVMATDVRQPSNETNPHLEEPEVLPLSLAGKWVAWSSDGMRIVAAGETIAEAERLAAEAGEPDPIFERHPGRARL